MVMGVRASSTPREDVGEGAPEQRRLRPVPVVLQKQQVLHARRTPAGYDPQSAAGTGKTGTDARGTGTLRMSDGRQCPCPGPHLCGVMTYQEILAAMFAHYQTSGQGERELTAIHRKWKRLGAEVRVP